MIKRDFSGRNALFIELSEIYENLYYLEKISGKKAIPVVKANAYGLGAFEVGRFLEERGYNFLAVATFEEAMELRERGLKAKILILSGSPDDPYEKMNKLGFIPVLHNFEQIKKIKSEVNSRLDVHLKFNTGMNRLGFNVEEDIGEILRCEKIRIRGVMTHFAKADTSKRFTQEQIRKFKKVLDRWKLNSYPDVIIHTANSAGILRGFTYGNMIRPGIFMYGALPTPAFPPVPSQKIPYHFTCRIINCRELKEGDRVSYGGIFVAKKKMRVAVLGCGYGDGIPRALSNRGVFIVNGKKVPVIGRICMDMSVVDVTGVSECGVGDSAIFMGEANGEKITADDVACKVSTIGYEILTGINLRVKRIYL